MNLAQLIEEAKQCLPEKRFLHSLGVVEEMEKMAPLCGADLEKAKIAAILHDITKPLSEEEHKKICQQFHIALNEVEQCQGKLLHAITGAVIAREKYGVDEEEILDAIRYHTTAKANMSPLCLALYLADYTEPNRDYPGLEELRKEIYANPYEGCLQALDFSICDIVNKGAMLHLDTIEARNFELMRKLK